MDLKLLGQETIILGGDSFSAKRNTLGHRAIFGLHDFEEKEENKWCKFRDIKHS